MAAVPRSGSACPLGGMSFSIRKSIWTDWPALAAAVGVPIFWGIHFAFPYLRPGAQSSRPVILPIIATAGLAVVLLWRVRRISNLFATGRTAAAKILRLSISRDRGRLEFEFEHQGQLVRSWSPVHKCKAVLALKQGDVVEALFDPARPTHAIIRHLYEA